MEDFYRNKLLELKDYCSKEAYWYDMMRFIKPNHACRNQKYIRISEAYIDIMRKIDKILEGIDD